MALGEEGAQRFRIGGIGLPGANPRQRQARERVRIMVDEEDLRLVPGREIGCGHRSVGHRRMLKLSSQTDPNFDFVAVCDLWSVNRESAAEHEPREPRRRP